MKKIIIDADPGTDDFIAISLALKSKEFDVLGITTVEGNCSLENATKNALKVLNMCDRDDIEVYKGLKNSDLETRNASDVHGNNGLGGIDYTPINRKENELSAIDFLIQTVNENPGQITVVALGPLTNIAECIRRDEKFANNVGSLLIMGGSTTQGNIKPFSEFNFYKDPYSAEFVLSSNIKEIIMFGWSITTRMPLIKKYEDILKNSEKELPRFIYDITRKTTSHDQELYGGAVISDPLLLAYLIDNSVVYLHCVNVEVITEGENFGRSVVKFVNDSNIKVAVSVDSDKFYNILFDAIL